MNDIFKTMAVPQLGDPNFQTQFSDFCNSIIQNIQRLISVQYTKGDKGDSVVTEEHVSNYRTYSQIIATGNLDTMGMSIIGAIFGSQPSSPTRGALYSMLNGSLGTTLVSDDYYYNEGVAPGMTVDGIEYNAIEDLIKVFEDPDNPGVNICQGLQLEINVDNVNGKAWLASPYLFIDGRIQGLNRMVRRNGHDEDYYKTFHDFSTAIYGVGEYTGATGEYRDNPLTWNWTMTSVPIVPKLYFDDEINEFCWEVNGQQTGITAQGIKGDDGITPNTIIAVGTKSPDGSTISIDAYQYIDADGVGRWTRQNPNWPNVDDPDEPMFLPAEVDNETEVVDPKNDDIAIVFYAAMEDPNDPYQAAYVGKVYIGDTGPYVVVGWDNQGRCDIFESIRMHDFWRLMVTINENITGSPRGYILPANPDDRIYPNLAATQGHLAYSERARTDSEGYGVLHVAPVKVEDTHQSSSDPQTDHIGDMQLDYNTKVQGNLGVQGVTNVNELHTQGNVTMHKNANVQGNLQVQGSIIGQDFTVIGREWPTKIENPKLAVMSRFKNTSYVLKRTWQGNPPSILLQAKDYKFTYQLILSGTLELNVGLLSQYYTNTCMDAAHKALQGYGSYWSNGKSQDDAQRTAFSNQPARRKSKLYDVVTYEIPFDLVKSVDSGVMRQAPSGMLVDDSNMWSYGTLPNIGTSDVATLKTKGNSRCRIIPCTQFSGIDLRMAISGFNNRASGPSILLGSDINGPIVQGITTLTPGTYGLQDATIGVENWNNSLQGNQGAVRVLSHKTDSSNELDTSNYEISGIIYYAPLETTLQYCFDFFVRLLEVDVSNWKLSGGNWKTDSVNFNMGLSITPVGGVSKSSGGIYLAPIWNAINVNDVGNKSIRSNINNSKKTEISGLNDEFNSVSIHRLGNIFNQNEQESVQSIGINPLIYDEYSFVSSGAINGINGPSGNIMVGEGVESQYIIGVFDKRSSNPSDHYIDCYQAPSLTTKYFDLTPNMRVVSDNIKVCPSNVKEGSWVEQYSPTRIGWEACEELPIAIIPYESIIEDFNANAQPGYLKIGCCNFQTKTQNDEPTPPMTLQGVLMYPYTACMVMMATNNTSYDVPDMYDDAVANPDASSQDIINHKGAHYVSSGRMMGVTNGEVNGMATRIVSGSSDLPEDWNESIQPGTV